jgi:hypothetical protein
VLGIFDLRLENVDVVDGSFEDQSSRTLECSV